VVAWIASSSVVVIVMTKTAVAVWWSYQHHHQFHIHWNIGDDAVHNSYSTMMMMMDPRRNNYHPWMAVVASTVAVHDDPLFVAYSQLQLFDHVDQSFFPSPPLSGG